MGFHKPLLRPAISGGRGTCSRGGGGYWEIDDRHKKSSSHLDLAAVSGG